MSRGKEMPENIRRKGISKESAFPPNQREVSIQIAQSERKQRATMMPAIQDAACLPSSTAKLWRSQKHPGKVKRNGKTKKGRPSKKPALVSHLFGFKQGGVRDSPSQWSL